MSPETAISLLKELVAATVGEPQWQGDGKITVTVGAKGLAFSVLARLEDEELFWDIDTGRPPASSGTVPAGACVTLTTVNNVDRIIIGPNIATLLNLRTARMVEPRAYMLWSDGAPLFHLASEPWQSLREPARSYHQAITLWQTLKTFAHHSDAASDSLWYFGIRKTEIAPGFEVADLTHPVDASAVVAFMGDVNAPEIRKEILASRLAEHLRDQEPCKRFPYLLHTVNAFARGLKEAMNIYLCEHSPEKLEEEAKLAAIDYTEKVEKIVGGLETKSLTVAPAILLAYKEISPGGHWFANLMIVLSAVVYFAAMLWVWFTQAALLDLLNRAIDAKKVDFEKKGLDTSNPILTETFKTLQDRAYKSEIFANVMAWCSAVPVVAAICKWALAK